MKTLFFLQLIFFSGMPNLAYALPFSGRLYSDQYLLTSPNRTNRLEQSSFSAWIDLDSKTEHGLGARAVTQFDFFAKDLNHNNQSASHIQVREAYASYFTPGSELKVGQQIIPWGKSDGINPTDYFTAKNFTLLNPDDEVKRIGAPALNYLFTPLDGTSPFTFQGVFQALYPQMKLLIPDQAIPTGLSFQKYPKSPQAFQSDSMEFGAKIAYMKSSYDFSISAFRGFAQYPEYIFDPSTVSVSVINPRETAFGGDASLNLDTYILRFESAVHLPDNGSSTDPLFGLVEPAHWDSVLGAERPFFTDFRVQFQLLYRWHFNYQDPRANANPNPILNQVQQAVGRANGLILNYQYQGNPGATLRFSFARETSLWTADLFLLGYFSSGQDFLIRPQVGLAPFTNFKLASGLDLYGGNTSRPLGALHDRSDAFFEGKYLF